MLFPQIAGSRMGEVHDWRICKCRLCLKCQRLLLLVYNEELGATFAKEAVVKLQATYPELLATFSSPAFRGEGALPMPSSRRERLCRRS